MQTLKPDDFKTLGINALRANSYTINVVQTNVQEKGKEVETQYFASTV